DPRDRACEWRWALHRHQPGIHRRWTAARPCGCSTSDRNGCIHCCGSRSERRGAIWSTALRSFHCCCENDSWGGSLLTWEPPTQAHIQAGSATSTVPRSIAHSLSPAWSCALEVNRSADGLALGGGASSCVAAGRTALLSAHLGRCNTRTRPWHSLPRPR